jgi:hypothetical protein
LPVIEPLDPVDVDNPFQYTKDEKEDLCMYQLSGNMKDTWSNSI